MYFKNNFDDVIKNLEYWKDFYKNARDAWRKVEITKTKSGKEFENLSRALVNAYKIQEYGFDRIKIFFYGARARESDIIDIYGYVDELPKDDPRRELGERNGYWRTHYILTPDEIRAKIEQTIELYGEKVKNYETQIKKARKAFDKFRNAIDKAEKELANFVDSDSDKPGHCSLYYRITETK